MLSNVSTSRRSTDLNLIQNKQNSEIHLTQDEEVADCDIPDSPSRTIPMTILTNPDRNPPTSLSASLVKYCISTKVHLIREMGLYNPYPKDYSMVETLHERVSSILDNIKPVLWHKNPDTSYDSQYPYLSQQRKELLTVVHTFLTALHRPHIRSHVQSRRAVLQAAIVVLDSQQRLFELTKRHHHILCHLSSYTLDAALLLSVVTVLYPGQSFEDTGNIHRALQQSRVRLSIMAPVNPTAISGLDIIQRCYHRLQGVIPPHLASAVVQPHDIRGARDHEQLNCPDSAPAESHSSPSNLT